MTLGASRSRRDAEAVGDGTGGGVTATGAGTPTRATRSRRRAEEGVESNARLTATTAVVLLVLLAAEGLTLLSVHSLLKPHVFIGMLLVPPVLLKMGSTGYRFVRYYLGSPAYRRRGPPPWFLRLLGPFVAVTTVTVLVTGVALLFVGEGQRSNVLFLHKASFILWFGAMALHVLAHALDTARLRTPRLVRKNPKAGARGGAPAVGGARERGPGRAPRAAHAGQGRLLGGPRGPLTPP